MNEKRFYIHYADDINKSVIDTESDFNIHIEEICSDEELIQLCNLLNEQDRKIRQLEKSIEQREEQISIIKKHCLKFLTDEQFEIIRKELEDE